MKKWKVFGRFSFISVFVIALVSLSPTQATAAGQWTLTGSTLVPHGNGQMAQLLDGRVMLVGTQTDATLPFTELYSEQTGQWQQTGSLNQRSRGFTPITLNDGRVLVAGGEVGPGGPTVNRAELYDPTTGQWSYTGSLNIGRINPVSVKLVDGRVLMISGMTQTGPTQWTNTVEVYNPATGQWTFTGSIDHPIANANGSDAAVLNDGRVLLIGGADGSSSAAQIYNPATGQWTRTTDVLVARFVSKLQKLQDGRVLMIAGDQWGNTVAECEIYDPTTGTWTPTGSLNFDRAVQSSVLLPDGRVFVAGGDSQAGTLRSSEIYDPHSRTWTLDATLNADHSGGQITMLPSGRILMAGGYGSGGATTTTELYTLGMDSDGDGIPDNKDDCPHSDLSATIVIDGCNAGVPNTLFASGCTISDFIAESATGASNHGQFVSCVSHLTNDLKKAGTITGQQQGAIQRCAAQADIP